MRISAVALSLVPALLVGCASVSANRKLGANESLQPRLTGGHSAPVVEISAPASVAILNIEPGGRVNLVYPTRPDQPTRFAAGAHRLTIDALPTASPRRTAGAGPCGRPGEHSIYPGEVVPAGASQTRRARYQGQIYTCFRYATHRPGSTPPEPQVLLIATEAPWSFAEISAHVQAFNQAPPRPAAEPTQVAAAIAPGSWAAYVRPLSNRR